MDDHMFCNHLTDAAEREENHKELEMSTFLSASRSGTVGTVQYYELFSLRTNALHCNVGTALTFFQYPNTANWWTKIVATYHSIGEVLVLCVLLLFLGILLHKTLLQRHGLHLFV